MNRPGLLSSVFLLALLSIAPVSAQDTLSLRAAPESGLWVDGTSNRSTWTVEAKELSGHVTLDGETVLETVLTVPAGKLESGRSRIMDRAMHQALKAAAHKEITFALTEPGMLAAGDDALTMTAKGVLTIGGVEKAIEMPVSVQENADGSWTFSGQYSLLMTDYGLEPPTLMFGALHTGDEVTVRFQVVAGS